MTIKVVARTTIMEGSLAIRVSEYRSSSSSAIVSSLMEKETLAGNDVKVSSTSVPEVITNACAMGPAKEMTCHTLYVSKNRLYHSVRALPLTCT